MLLSSHTPRQPSLELPERAPLVRITAGAGTASQKTWNLRRPVTLIGAKRPSHIVLHDPDISAAHCVIVNTGKAVLIYDLYTKSGTRRNGEPKECWLLADGDVVEVGSTIIQVAVTDQWVPEGGDNGSADDPFLLPQHHEIALVHTAQSWTLMNSATLVGAHELAPIRLEHNEISRRHALFFRFGDGLAVFDMAGRDGVRVNGKPTTVATLQTGDRVRMGSFTFVLDQAVAPPEPVEVEDGEVAESDPPSPNRLEDISLRLDALQADIAESWNGMNQWRTRSEESSEDLPDEEAELVQREEALEARDAMLRGKLHDITMFQEQLVDKENELNELKARLESQEVFLAEKGEALDAKDDQLKHRAEDLSRREHVFAQRWAKLQTAKCAHCGHSVMRE